MDFDSRFVLLDGLVVFARAEVSISLKRDHETFVSRRASVATGAGGTNGTEEDVQLPFAFLPQRI